MSKSRQIKVWGAIVLIVLFATAWIYIKDYRHQEMLIRADARIEAGIASFKDGNYPEALRIFENIPAGAPREWYARYYQGSTYIMLKQYQPAINYLEQALALNPTETQIMHALGVVYFKLGKFKISKAYYVSILEIDPGDSEARGLLETLTNLEKRQLEEPPDIAEETPDHGNTK